jgi:hypothetical protein
MDEFHKIQPSRRNGRVERKKKKKNKSSVRRKRKKRSGGRGKEEEDLLLSLSLFPSATLLVLATGKD